MFCSSFFPIFENKSHCLPTLNYSKKIKHLKLIELQMLKNGNSTNVMKTILILQFHANHKLVKL